MFLISRERRGKSSPRQGDLSSPTLKVVVVIYGSRNIEKGRTAMSERMMCKSS